MSKAADPTTAMSMPAMEKVADVPEFRLADVGVVLAPVPVPVLELVVVAAAPVVVAVAAAARVDVCPEAAVAVATWG